MIHVHSVIRIRMFLLWGLHKVLVSLIHLRRNTESPVDKYPWKYVHPVDKIQTMTVNGKLWKFCKHCVCRYSKKNGFYNLLHTSSEQLTTLYAHQYLMALYILPLDAIVNEPTEKDVSSTNITNESPLFVLSTDQSDHLEFTGIWLTSVEDQPNTQVINVSALNNADSNNDDTPFIPSRGNSNINSEERSMSFSFPR